MNLYKTLRKVTIWAGDNTQIARALCIISSLFMALSGMWIGWGWFEVGYQIPMWFPFVLLGVCMLVSILFKSSKHKANGKRRGAKIRYYNRLIRFTVYAYSTFLLTVCNGNMIFDNKVYTLDRAWDDWTLLNTKTDRTQMASVEYNVPPPVERIQKKSRKSKRINKRSNAKRYKSKMAIKEMQSYKGKFVGFLLLSLFLALLSCATACIIGFAAPQALIFGIILGVLIRIGAIAAFITCVFAKVRHNETKNG